MKIDSDFQYDMFRMLLKPIRDADQKEGGGFLERFLTGPQTIFEDMQAKIKELPDIMNPAKTRADLLVYLKDHVGFTKELNNITNGLSESDLRKLISLGVAMFKQKGTDKGYANIVRLFTGKSARIFNYFDYRFIVGETALGEEQLGEDAWMISRVGVEATSDIVNTVVALLTFESHVQDRSPVRNHGVVHGFVDYYSTPNSGFPAHSDKYIHLNGAGMVEIPPSEAYDLGGSFTVEAYFRTTVSAGLKTLFALKDGAGKGFSVEINTSTNDLIYTLYDGSVTVTDTLPAGADLDDGTPRHIALVVKRGSGARLYLRGSESTSLLSVAGLGDLTNVGSIMVGGSAPGVALYKGDLDNFRLSLNAVYTVTSPTLTPPISGFTEYEEEALDEFYTDIRIVDEGSINKTLVQRILNLMRPVSERIRVIFTRFFDDFVDGVGQFNALEGSVTLNTDGDMELAAASVVSSDVLGDEDFQNILLQVKAKSKGTVGGTISVLLYVQDANNYYELRIDTDAKTAGLWKIAAGAPTQLGSNVIVDVVPDVFYVFSVSMSYNAQTTDVLIQTAIDEIKLHKQSDGSFTEGKFGMKAGSAIMQIESVEMLELPVDVKVIGPNFSL